MGLMRPSWFTLWKQLNPRSWFVYVQSKFVIRSRKMSHLSKIPISIFLHHFLKTLKRFILMQTPLQMNIWLQSYEGFDNAKNNMKQRNLNTVFANIPKTTSPTSDSFLLIMSHLLTIIEGLRTWFNLDGLYWWMVMTDECSVCYIEIWELLTSENKQKQTVNKGSIQYRSTIANFRYKYRVRLCVGSGVWASKFGHLFTHNHIYNWTNMSW